MSPCLVPTTTNKPWKMQSGGGGGWRSEKERRAIEGLDQSRPDRARCKESRKLRDRWGRGVGVGGGAAGEEEVGESRGSWGGREVPELSNSPSVLVEHSNSLSLQPQRPPTTAPQRVVALGSLSHSTSLAITAVEELKKWEKRRDMVPVDAGRPRGKAKLLK